MSTSPRLRPTHRLASRTTLRIQNSRPLGPCAATDCHEPARVSVLWTPEPTSPDFRYEVGICPQHAVAGELADTVTIPGV